MYLCCWAPNNTNPAKNIQKLCIHQMLNDPTLTLTCSVQC